MPCHGDDVKASRTIRSSGRQLVFQLRCSSAAWLGLMACMTQTGGAGAPMLRGEFSSALFVAGLKRIMFFLPQDRQYSAINEDG